MKKFFRILGILIVLIAAFFVVKTQTTRLTFSSTPEVTTLANPASVYCIQQSGTLEIVDETGGQVGMCHLSGGVVCEEWAYMRGECPGTGVVGIDTGIINNMGLIDAIVGCDEWKTYTTNNDYLKVSFEYPTCLGEPKESIFKEEGDGDNGGNPNCATGNIIIRFPYGGTLTLHKKGVNLIECIPGDTQREPNQCVSPGCFFSACPNGMCGDISFLVKYVLSKPINNVYDVKLNISIMSPDKYLLPEKTLLTAGLSGDVRGIVHALHLSGLEDMSFNDTKIINMLNNERENNHLSEASVNELNALQRIVNSIRE